MIKNNILTHTVSLKHSKGCKINLSWIFFFFFFFFLGGGGGVGGADGEGDGGRGMAFSQMGLVYPDNRKVVNSSVTEYAFL